MSSSFVQKKPFVIKIQRDHTNIHSGEQWTDWKAYVGFADGRVYTLYVLDEPSLIPQKVSQYNWKNPQVKYLGGEKYLGCENQFDVYYDVY